MKVIQGEQYSDLWWQVRRGIPTASEFDKILTPKTLKPSSQTDSYICRLIGDTLDLCYPRKDSYATAAMRRGHEYEPESRKWYELEVGQDVQQVCFCTNDEGTLGCSPDGLVGEEGGLQLKNPDAATHISYLLGECLPTEYLCQVHGELIVTGRKWWDFVSYCPGAPAFRVRVVPDDFTKALRVALAGFLIRYQEILAKVRAME